MPHRFQHVILQRPKLIPSEKDKQNSYFIHPGSLDSHSMCILLLNRHIIIIIIFFFFFPGSESIDGKQGRETGQGIGGGRYFTGRHDDEPMDKDQTYNLSFPKGFCSSTSLRAPCEINLILFLITISEKKL